MASPSIAAADPRSVLASALAGPRRALAPGAEAGGGPRARPASRRRVPVRRGRDALGPERPRRDVASSRRPSSRRTAPPNPAPRGDLLEAARHQRDKAPLLELFGAPCAALEEPCPRGDPRDRAARDRCTYFFDRGLSDGVRVDGVVVAPGPRRRVIAVGGRTARLQLLRQDGRGGLPRGAPRVAKGQLAMRHRRGVRSR